METLIVCHVPKPESYQGCKGWFIQDLGSEKVYINYIDQHGPIYCDVHDCDAMECFR